ncbi:MAG TPA: TonB family protein [bacterium]|jgi:protein TonB
MDFFEQLEKGRYGSFELKRQVGPNLLKGLLVSFLIHSTVIASPFIIARLFLHEAAIPLPPIVVTEPTRIIPYEADPPSVVRIALPKPDMARYVLPVPVPIDQVDRDAPQVPDQTTIKRVLGGTPLPEPGEGTGQVVYREPPTDTEVIPDPKEYRPVEVDPLALSSNPQPEYPDLAQISGMSGRVIVQAYVDKRGNIQKWQFVQVNPAGFGFEEEVAKVITKWKFTPAIQGGNAIGVWVTVPFKFNVKK